MNLSEKEKEQIVRGFVDIFTRVENKNYQRRIWIKGEGPEMDSFEDTVCDFFIECESILENHKAFGITKAQYQLLKKFRDKFRAFSDQHNWPPEFIDSPEWDKITRMAKEVLVAFDYQKNRKASERRGSNRPE